MIRHKAWLFLVIIFMGCHKHHDDVAIPGLSATGTLAPHHLAVGAGQSNMQFMNLVDFQKNAPDIARTSNIAVGGSALNEWTKGTAFYSKLVQQFSSTQEPVSVVLWWQGEAEGLSGIDYLTWGQRFSQFVLDLRADTHTNVAFIVVKIGAVPDGTSPIAWDSIRDQQAALSIPGVTVVSVDDIARTNGVHYAPDAYTVIAGRLASVYEGE